MKSKPLASFRSENRGVMLERDGGGDYRVVTQFRDADGHVFDHEAARAMSANVAAYAFRRECDRLLRNALGEEAVPWTRA